MNDRTQRTLVLGVGNPLMGDEGVGPRIVEYLLSRYSFPANVDVIDAGTMGLTMLNVFEGVDLAIVADAIQGTDHDPGTVLMLDPDSLAPNQIMHSLHDARLPDVLDAAKLLGMEPDVLCVAVQVAEITHWQLELSPAVERAIPNASQAIVDLLSERGIIAERRVTPSCGRESIVEHAAPGDDETVEHRQAADDPDRAVKILRSLRTKDDIGV